MYMLKGKHLCTFLSAFNLTHKQLQGQSPVFHLRPPKNLGDKPLNICDSVSSVHAYMLLFEMKSELISL